MSDNPFLLPPGGAPPDPRPPSATEPDSQRDAGASAPADPRHYIAVPASVESVTHRVARPAPEPELIAPEPEPEPEREPEPTPKHLAPEPAGAAQQVDDAIAEETRLAPPVAPKTWALTLPDGTRVSLDGPLLLGRDPAGVPSHPEARLLPLVDTGKTVSKTHALLEPTADGVLVHELHSTNGVAIDTSTGRELLPAGGVAVAPFGATVMLGSFAIGVATG